MLKDSRVFPYVASGVGKMIKCEIKKMCSTKTDSILNSKDKKHISDFPWESVKKEIIQVCPALHTILQAATTSMLRGHIRMNLSLCWLLCCANLGVHACHFCREWFLYCYFLHILAQW